MGELRVGMLGLKSKLSEYLRKVMAGQTIVVTARGKSIGEIVPVRSTVKERLNAMVAEGLADWNGEKFQPKKPTAMNKGTRQASDIVVENRE